MKTVWFLDADGVVALDERPDYGDHEYVEVPVGSGLVGVWFSPTVIVAVNSAHRHGVAEIVWLTSWGHDAPALLAPALGLDDFDVLADPGDPALSDDPRAAAWWKRVVLTRHLAARPALPVVWTDDELPCGVSEDISRTHPGGAMLITPRGTTGLLVEDVHAVEAFASAAWVPVR